MIERRRQSHDNVDIAISVDVCVVAVRSLQKDRVAFAGIRRGRVFKRPLYRSISVPRPRNGALFRPRIKLRFWNGYFRFLVKLRDADNQFSDVCHWVRITGSGKSYVEASFDYTSFPTPAPFQIGGVVIDARTRDRTDHGGGLRETWRRRPAFPVAL